MNILEINSLVLAYLGDTVYEYYVRKHLIESRIANVNDLQKASINYVSAKNQASFLQKMLDINFLTDEELDIIKRSRNHKGKSHPKNCDIVTYKHATALESLIGYLKLENNDRRIEEIMTFILNTQKEKELC